MMPKDTIAVELGYERRQDHAATALLWRGRLGNHSRRSAPTLLSLGAHNIRGHLSCRCRQGLFVEEVV
jgi:hypothetical protein